MGYWVVKANIDKEGLLKDLAEIRKKAEELNSLARDVVQKIELEQESAEHENPADS